jgi:hypothetical protein
MFGALSHAEDFSIIEWSADERYVAVRRVGGITEDEVSTGRDTCISLVSAGPEAKGIREDIQRA